MKPFLVAIAGGSASGKTTIARTFAARVGALLISYDRYYRPFADPETANFDHPDALDTTLLVAHLDTLLAGGPADLPIYDYLTHRRETGVDPVRPRPVIVVEGILALADAHLRARFDLPVWVHAPDDIRFIRRLLRDTRERGRTMQNVVDQYLGTVRPMHEKFVAPSQAFATLVLDGAGDLEDAVAGLIAALA